MKSPFAPYQGGIQPLQGIQEAGAQIANMQYQSMSQFGANIAEGLKQYNKNAALSEQTNAKAEALKNRILQTASYFEGIKEYAPMHASLMAQAQAMAEAPAKGLSQRRAIVEEGELAMRDIGNTLQLFEFGRKQKAIAAVNEALGAQSNDITQTETAKIILDGSKFGPDATIEMLRKSERSKYDAAAREASQKSEIMGASGAGIQMEPFESVWAKKLDVIRKGVEGYTKMPKDLQATWLGIIDRYKKAQDDGTSGWQEVMKGMSSVLRPEGRQRIVSGLKKAWSAAGEQIAAESAVPLEEAKRVDVNALNAAIAKQKTAEEELAKTRKQIEEGNYVSQPAAELAADTVGLIGRAGELVSNRFAFRSLARGLKEFEALKGNNIKITPDVAEQLVRSNSNFKESLGGLSLIAGNIRAIFDYINPLESLTQTEKQNIAAAIQRVYGKQESVQNVGSFDVYDTLKNNERVYMRQIDEAKAQQAQIQAKATSSVLNKDIATTPISVEGVQAGTQAIFTQISRAEREIQVRDYLQKKLGYTPYDTSQILEAALPKKAGFEAGPNGTYFLVQPDGKREQVKFGEGFSTGGMSGVGQGPGFGQYGVVLPNGKTSSLVLVGGTMVSGSFKGPKESLKDFNDEITVTDAARDDIIKLKQLISTAGIKTADRELVAKIETLTTQVLSRIRREYVGPGAVSDKDMEMLRSMIKVPVDASGMFTFASTTKAQLELIQSRIENTLENRARIYGVNVSYQSPSGTDKVAEIAARQRYGKMQSEIQK